MDIPPHFTHKRVVTTTRPQNYTDVNKRRTDMKKSSTTLIVFGVYLIGMGVGLLFTPNMVFGILGLPATDEVWPHVVGLLALVLAFYYITAGRADLKPFAKATVPARIAVFVGFAAFVVMGLVGPVMILLGSVDLLGALWTGWALKAEG
jgi:hypothetical protein